MKVKCEATERGALVNLSMTRASEQLINGKSIILKPQRTKTSEHQSKVCPVTPGITRHIKKEISFSLLLSLLPAGEITRQPSCPQSTEVRDRLEVNVNVISRQQEWENAHVLHPTLQVRRKK